MINEDLVIMLFYKPKFQNSIFASYNSHRGKTQVFPFFLRFLFFIRQAYLSRKLVCIDKKTIQSPVRRTFHLYSGGGNGTDFDVSC